METRPLWWASSSQWLPTSSSGVVFGGVHLRDVSSFTLARGRSSRASPLSNPVTSSTTSPTKRPLSLQPVDVDPQPESVVPPGSVTRDKSQSSTKRKLFKSTLVVAVCVSLLWVLACVRVFLVVSGCVDFCGAFPWFLQPAQRCPTVYQGMTRKAKRTFKERLSSVETRLSRPKGGLYGVRRNGSPGPPVGPALREIAEG